MPKLKPQIMKDLGVTNVHRAPKVTKVVINMSVGEAAQDSKKLQFAVR